jgi:hypothetical protein
MSLKITAMADRFHGYFDSELFSKATGVIDSKDRKYFIVKERDLSYRFYLHEHPYVNKLVPRLLSKGVKGLQAADTEYAPDGASLPGSIEIAIEASTNVTVPRGARVMLLKDLPDAGLTADSAFKLGKDAAAILPDGLKAILTDGMKATPATGAVFTPPPNSQSVVADDTRITLSAPTALNRPGGKTETVPAGTELLLASGNRLTIPNDAQVKLLKSKPLPVLFKDFFEGTYGPNPAMVEWPYPVKDLDFTASGAYAVYNWELFFHVPITIAIHLSKNQRFAEAQRWFHYIFDPTDDSDGPTPERFWKVRPFQYTDVKKIEEILINLSIGADKTLRADTVSSIEAWKNAPFRPHVIARFRQQAYMYKTVMAYLDNLIDWGDSLFRQDTGEAIDEALMLYVLAANILGPRPQAVPKKGTVRPQNYANLRKDLDEFGNAMRDVEAALPFDLMPFPADDAGDNDQLASVRSLGKALYFCVPRNDQLLSYWDTVSDRLFKIRNSLNFQGVFRQLALFEPPIDPALLARAAAAGLDVGSIVNGLNQPLPLVRFTFLVQKAAEIVQEVKSLGNSLLSTMEKEDGEALAILRAKHERVVMEMVEHVKYGQLQEAIKAKEGLYMSLALAKQRYTYYQLLMGKKENEIAIPELEELSREDKEKLAKIGFMIQEPVVSVSEIEVDIANDLGASGGKIMSSHEKKELDASHSARDWQVRASTTEIVVGALNHIPSFGVRFEPFGTGGTMSFGGSNLGAALSATARYQQNLGAQDSYDATHAGKMAGFQRREQDWAFQGNLAAGEINQIFKQLRAAQIREAIAELELKNHQQQMKHAEEIEHFLNEEGTDKSGKKTNKALYTWMKREVKGLYAQCFQLAFDIAKKAERALQHELSNPDLSYLQFGYLAGKEGLLAGEKLYLDIKRMEMAYHDLNQREYELTKHVSLLQVDPLALLHLRTTGRCTVALPEELFDMDGPGHYFRRIKTVAVSIPCVTGPYASVNCKLTLLKSRIRTTPTLRGGNYAREDAEDDRFNDYFGSLQSIVTSSAQNDSGLFETNLRDERYLPFENSGVISEWNLELPGDIRQFDYDSISDVILHIRYTSREGGGLLRKGAVDNLKELIGEAKAAGCVRLFSIRHEFPSEWTKFQKQTPNADQRYELTLNLQETHYPFWIKGKLKSEARVELFVQSTQNQLDVYDVRNNQNSLPKSSSLAGLLGGALSNLENPVGELKLFFGDKTMTDLWIAITWNGKLS